MRSDSDHSDMIAFLMMLPAMRHAGTYSLDRIMRRVGEIVKEIVILVSSITLMKCLANFKYTDHWEPNFEAIR